MTRYEELCRYCRYRANKYKETMLVVRKNTPRRGLAFYREITFLKCGSPGEILARFAPQDELNDIT